MTVTELEEGEWGLRMLLDEGSRFSLLDDGRLLKIIGRWFIGAVRVIKVGGTLFSVTQCCATN